MTPAETERAKIAAWLRERKLWTAERGFITPQDLADAIERGDHEGIEI